MNPGRSADTMTCLRSSAARPRIAASVASSVALPRMSSISGITGTGLKKCIPTNRARRGSPTAAASVSIEIDDVFEAKIAPAGAIASRRRPQVGLDAEVLEHGLDDEVRVGRRGRGRRWRRGGRGSRRAPRRGACSSRRRARGCRRSGRGRRSPARGRARTGRPACRSRRGPARCRGPSGRRLRRRRARCSSGAPRRGRHRLPRGLRHGDEPRPGGEQDRRTQDRDDRRREEDRRVAGAGRDRREEHRREPEREVQEQARRPDDRAALRGRGRG